MSARLSTREVMAMAENSGMTPEQLGEGFLRRAERGWPMGYLTIEELPTWTRDQTQAARDCFAAALEFRRAVYSLAAVYGGASFHGARFDDIQLPPVLAPGWDQIDGGQEEAR